uniref:Uncharacterized protein n=1 Tax=Cannabis sativa TaxID=3483 RepID=A0A803QDM4_CANSA
MKEFLNRADNFIKLEEAIRQAQIGHVNSRQSRGTQQPHDPLGIQVGNNNAAQTPCGKNTRNKRSTNNFGRNSGKRRKFKTSSTPEKNKEENYTCFTLLIETYTCYSRCTCPFGKQNHW